MTTTSWFSPRSTASPTTALGDAPLASPPAEHCRPVAGGTTGTYPAGSCGQRREIAQADQVVDGQGEGEHPVHPPRAPAPSLAQPADRLEPAEDLLHALASPLCHRIARVAGGPSVDVTRALCSCSASRGASPPAGARCPQSPGCRSLCRPRE